VWIVQFILRHPVVVIFWYRKASDLYTLTHEVSHHTIDFLENMIKRQSRISDFPLCCPLVSHFENTLNSHRFYLSLCKIWRHPPNRKCITLHLIAVRKTPNHGHKQHSLQMRWSWDVWLPRHARRLAGIQTYQHADRNTSHPAVRLWSYDLTALYKSVNYYPRESFREGLWNHRRTFVCLFVGLSVCLLPR